MKRLVVAAGLVAALLAPIAAQAHPLGNFTINRFSRIEVSGPRVYVFYVLDMAEIPTFQAGKIDAAAYARHIAANAHLTVGGRPVALVPLKRALAHPMGAGGLHTTRLEIVLRGPVLAGASSFAYRDANYSDRIGWKEVLVGASTASRSHELRSYPKDMLQSPLDVTAASGQLAPAHGPDVVPALSSGKSLEAPDRVADAGFAKLVGRSHLSLLVILVSLGAAIFWGAAHALSPGHGKTIVTAYLVGQRGTPWHAALLGLIVTVTHTIGVFGLGIVTLLLSQFIVPDHLYPWLNLASGLLVVGIGGSVLFARVRPRLRHRLSHARGHEHDHGHSHGHRPRPRPRPQPRAEGARVPRPGRGRRLGRPPPVPVGARRPARGDLAPPGRVRPGADRRVQPRPRPLDHGRRPGRGAREARLRAAQLRGPRRLAAPGRECPRDRDRRRRDDAAGGAEARRLSGLYAALG